MPDLLTVDRIRALAPTARAQYVVSLMEPGALSSFGISTPLRLAHFMAQILHESGRLTILMESLRYTHAERLMAVWPKRFPTIDSAKPFVNNPEALANFVYMRAELGNVNPGDGWKFIGRGPLQITGRDAYERGGKLLDIPLADNPDLAFDQRYAAKLAAAEWQWSGCNAAADTDDVRLVTRKVNGGQIGINERTALLAEAKKVLGI